MVSKTQAVKGDLVAALAYIPTASLIVYMWGNTYHRRFHGYQGIGLIAFAIVALLLTDIICGLLGSASFWYLFAVGVLYVVCTMTFALLTYAGIKIDMKIYKSPVEEEI